MWLLTTACIGGIEGWKICAIGKPFIDACLVIMTNNNRCLFSLHGSFALSKNAHLPGITVNEATFCGLRRSKALWKFPLLSLSDLIAAISNYSFCDPQHKMLFVAYEGRGIYGKRLHSQNDVLLEEKKLTLINCSRWSIHVFEILKYW